MSDDSPWMPPTEGSDDAMAPTDAFPAPSIPAPSNPAPSIPAPSIPAPSIPAPSIPAPSVPAPPPPLPTMPTSEATPPPPPLPGTWPGDGAVPEDALVPVGAPPERSKRSKWFVGAATASVLAVGASGVFAVANLTGSSAGGAGSPEELGFELMAAIEQEDVLGVIDVLSPGERDVFRDPLVDLVAELTRLEVLSPDADLARLVGVDVELTDESVSAVSTNVPDIANIDLRADATLTLDGAELPIGDLITDNLPDDMLTEMRGTRVTETDRLDIRLTAVQEDGQWYFSVLHTIAELARADLADGTLIPVEGVGADGADTPGAAFDGLLDRVEALDLTGLIRTLNPGEAAALQRYAPLFLEEAEAALDEVPLEWEITRREFRVDESGDTASVFLDALEIEGTIDGGSFSFGFDGGCVRVAGEGESFEQCDTGAFDDELGVLDDAPAVEALIETVTDAFSDIEEIGLEMRRTDGLWYVSPTTTLTEALLKVLRALDRSELDAIVEQVPEAVDEFFDAFLGGIGTPLEDLGLDGGDLVVAGDPEGGATGGIDVGEGELPTGGGDDCYAEPDPTAAAACFEVAVASGELPPIAVPVVLRYPECGYAIAWGGELYALSDEAFIAAAEAARPCFLDLVARGEIEEYELPNEIVNLECFEGRNWYNVFDDPEYDERYYDCLEAAYGE